MLTAIWLLSWAVRRSIINTNNKIGGSSTTNIQMIQLIKLNTDTTLLPLSPRSSSSSRIIIIIIPVVPTFVPQQVSSDRIGTANVHWKSREKYKRYKIKSKMFRRMIQEHHHHQEVDEEDEEETLTLLHNIPTIMVR